MADILRVGVIGASLDRGWANKSHLPALRLLRGVELAGVSGRTQEAADATAATVGATRGFKDVDSMIADPSIDVITVAVRVPAHRELVLKALRAGKHVYCEWPLGRNVQEAEELRDAAKSAGVHVAIGLQTRMNPALRKAMDLIKAGALGRILSARMYSGTVAFGATESESDSYLENPENGATHLTIHGGHAVDAVVALLGGFDVLNALGTIQYKEIDVEKGKRVLERTIPDHLLIQGRLVAGAGVGIEIDGGKQPGDTRFRFEITGEQGSITLEGGAAVGFQAGRLALLMSGVRQSVEEGELASLPEAAANVGAMYAALRDDIADDRRSVPSFDHAVKLTRLLSDVDQSANRGQRARCAHWPEH
jgi:predicted dehydrogenase